MPITHSNTFKKQERLKSRKLIEQLFTDGVGYNQFPIKVLYKVGATDMGVPLQATVSVSSRNFKKAVDRNRIKRQMREAYRLQKNDLQLQLIAAHKNMVLFFIYTGKELPVYEFLQQKMKVVLDKLEQFVNQ